jgi:agmatinase
LSEARHDDRPSGSGERNRTGRGAEPTFFDLPPEAADPADAAVLVIPVPYDGTASWIKGTAGGPRAIREASRQVELWDIETAGEPWRYGIAAQPPIELPDSPEALAERVAGRVAAALEAGRLPVVLGGEHSVSIGAIRAAAAAYPRLTVLQIDAHADTRESYEGSTHNHACVMARARELCPIVQVGIRSVGTEEVPGLDPDRVFWAHEIVRDRGGAWIDEVVGLLTHDVYVTIDVDGFDPAYVPATGTPEPGGLDWHQVNGLLSRVAQQRHVVGFDIVELIPGHPPSAFLAAKLLYRILAEIFAAGEATGS